MKFFNLKLKKYWLVAKNTWTEATTYRLNFVMWRLRVILQLLTMYYLWLVILPQGQTLFGYDQSSMLTYILGTSLISAFVIASRTYSVGDEINQGNLSNFLIKPINYFLYHFSRDIGDKAMNISFSIFELSFLFLILQPPLFIQTNIYYLILFFLATAVGIILYFLINFLLGLVGFWSPEVWAPRFIFFVVLTFFAGGLFPLDILPTHIFSIFKILPFGYLLYFPLKIYLGQIAFGDIYLGLLVSCVWTIVFYLIVKFIWYRGLKVYTAYGR